MQKKDIFYLVVIYYANSAKGEYLLKNVLGVEQTSKARKKSKKS